MTSKEYLELTYSCNNYYVEMHNHGVGCTDCQVSRVMRDVARRMLDNLNYPDNLNVCIRLYYDNILYILYHEPL